MATVFSDEPSQPTGTKPGGFPPASGSGKVSRSRAVLPGDDTGNPVSTGRGGIAASLRVKKAGTKDAPGKEKTVNEFQMGLQTQAPGYMPNKPGPGVKRANRKGGVTGGQPSRRAKKQVRKTSPYSKNRTGVKTTKMATGYKSMMLGNPIQKQVPQSNMPGAFNFPGSAPLL